MQTPYGQRSPIPVGGRLGICVWLLVATPLCSGGQGHLAPGPLSLLLGLYWGPALTARAHLCGLLPGERKTKVEMVAQAAP